MYMVYGGEMALCLTGLLISGFRFTIAHQNYKPIVKKSGVELEINYDMGKFSLQICLMHTNEQINQPIMQMRVHVLTMRQKRIF